MFFSRKGLVLGFTLLSGLVAADPLTPKLASNVGSVASLSGRVTSNDKPVQAGSPIFEGDRIKTSPESRAKLLMKDQTVVDLSPSSEFLVKKYNLQNKEGRQIEVGSEEGTVRTLINKRLEKKGRFQFRTRTSVLAIRGTEFFVQTPPNGQENVTVTEGRIQIIPDGLPPLSLGSSQQWAGGEISGVTGREIASVTDTGRVADNTFDSYVGESGTEGSFAGRDTLGAVSATFTPPTEIPVKIGDFVEARVDKPSPTQDPANSNIINRTEYSLKVKFNP